MAYSDLQQAEALVKLAINQGDYDKTAEDTGISRRTLIRWAKVAPKKGVAELLERAIERLLMVIPKDMDGQEWAVALGILFDKWLLIQGEPTSRTETIERKLEELDEDEYSSVIREAEAIIRAASSS